MRTSNQINPKFVEVKTPYARVMVPESEFDSHWMIHFLRWVWKLFGIH